MLNKLRMFEIYSDFSSVHEWKFTKSLRKFAPVLKFHAFDPFGVCVDTLIGHELEQQYDAVKDIIHLLLDSF